LTADVFFAVLLAAFLHAAWNALIKTRLDRFLSVSLMSFGMGAISLACLPFVAVPQGMTWVWILLSAALHTGYKLFLIKAYNAGDLGQVYPLARGAAPLLTTLGGALLVGEFVPPLVAASIVVMCAGITLMSLRGGSGLGRLDSVAVTSALATSLFISAYTLTDGVGGRSAPSASSYTVWLFLVDGFWMGLFGLAVRGRAGFRAMLPEWKTGLLTGALSLGAYWIVIWAMTKAPIGAVAALRETSILFAIALSALFLKERLSPWRVGAAFLILAGVVGLRIG
jgi:drug/metabolite transporter (DMT)-like permease